MVGPAVLTFVKELGEFYGSNRPQIFGFIDSLEAVDIASPGLEFLDGTHFWEGLSALRPGRSRARPTSPTATPSASTPTAPASSDAKDVSTYSHMFGCWETLYVIKQAMEASGYQGAGRPQAS